MSAHRRNHGVDHGRCRVCDHDLEVRIEDAGNATHPHSKRPMRRGTSDGHYYCSWTTCRYYDRPHPMGQELSVQGAALKTRRKSA